METDLFVHYRIVAGTLFLSVLISAFAVEKKMFSYKVANLVHSFLFLLQFRDFELIAFFLLLLLLMAIYQ